MEWFDNTAWAQDTLFIVALVVLVWMLATREKRRDGETVESVTSWADETFKGATIRRQIERAREEFTELERAMDAGDMRKVAIEAADVCICLYRTIGTIHPTAIDDKMAVNRARQWNVGPDGCGYHVKEAGHE